MRVVIAGGHGQIALLLQARLAVAGHRPVGLVRKAEHVPDLEGRGAEAVVLDLESAGVDDLAAVAHGADAVVFAAGAGPGSGAERKWSVDRDAAIRLADAAEAAGVRRYLMVSSMGTDGADPDSDDAFQVYLRAKAAADAEVRSRDLEWTIVQPGGLTDAEGTGLVTLDPASTPRQVPRADVAHVLHACLEEPATLRRQLTVLTGGTPVAEALRAL